MLNNISKYIGTCMAFLFVQGSVRENLNSLLNQCCTFGSLAAENKTDCDKLKLDSNLLNNVTSYNLAGCLTLSRVCCLKSHQKFMCSRGQREATTLRSCTVVTDDRGSDFYKECCYCCKLGIIAQNGGHNCSLMDFGEPCDTIFMECCRHKIDENKWVNKSTISLQPTTISRQSCQVKNPCQQICRIVNHRYHCSCRKGFRLQADFKTCSDIDECQRGYQKCQSPGYYCQNLLGSYRCLPNPTCPIGHLYNTATRLCEDLSNKRCFDGFIFNDVSGQCEDKNECGLGQYACSAEMRCENNIGSYKCVRIKGCGTGYTLDEPTQKCLDVDECFVGTHNCGDEMICVNLRGSFECRGKKCAPGHRLDLATGLCREIKCKLGHRSNVQGRCTDINECMEDPSICGRNQRCINTMGSYRCRNRINCPIGYEMDQSGTRCLDVDECSRNTHRCLPTQECRNRPGTFICQCPDGHTMTRSGLCQDIDECKRYRAACPSSSTCHNTIGGYHCICREGFKKGINGKSCTDIDECLEKYKCHHECINNYGSYTCLCYPGYKLAPDRRLCQDINECLMFINPCQGKCINSPGSYYCSCPRGFSLNKNQRTCQDINECAVKRDLCTDGSVCTNTAGGHRCTKIECPSGFSLNMSSPRSAQCIRDRFICSPQDIECFTNHLVQVSYYFHSFQNTIAVPTDLFHITGDTNYLSTFKYQFISAQPLRTGMTPADDSYFSLKMIGQNQAVISVQKRVEAPQDIELVLETYMYRRLNNALYGSRIAKFYIFVIGDIKDMPY